MSCGGIFDYPGTVERLEELEAQTADPEFWNDGDAAQVVLREQNTLKKLIERLDDAGGALEDAVALYELAREASDPESAAEAWETMDEADKKIEHLEFRRMLAGEHDSASALLSINAGAGGVDSQDWAEMMLRMFQRWGERKGFEVRVIDVQEGDQAGIRGADVSIEGDYAYGWLRSEIGVHRLVRISPFDSQARRQTSFSSVMVLPDIGDDQLDVEVVESDLRVDKYRASGAGGQHVNKTESAVRLTHLPTGIVVRCQNERSQHKNRATAWSMLKAKILAMEEAKRDAEMSKLYGEKGEIAWGSQIRSYVLQPYQMVKDLRTSEETNDVQGVMDDARDPFLDASLRQGVDRPGDDADS